MEDFDRLLERAVPVAGDDCVSLDFRRREKARQRAVLESGETVSIRLPRGTLLRGGDVIGAASGRCVTVVAAAEAVSTVCCNDAVALARVAYHLGNRHVRLQIGPGWVRYLSDHVLDAMVRGLGADPVAHVAPFEPETGAYHNRAHADPTCDDHEHTHGAPHDHAHSH